MNLFQQITVFFSGIALAVAQFFGVAGSMPTDAPADLSGFSYEVTPAPSLSPEVATERAIKAAIGIYIIANEEERSELVKIYSPSGDEKEAIRGLARKLDGDSVLLDRAEGLIASRLGQNETATHFPGQDESDFAPVPASTSKTATANVCNCKGYTGPGGPCYDGPGGPAYDGPGGPAYDGPGGPCYDGPGGACYSGPGGGDNCPIVCK